MAVPVGIVALIGAVGVSLEILSGRSVLQKADMKVSKLGRVGVMRGLYKV